MPSADPGALRLMDLARRSRDDLEARLLLAAAVHRVATGLGMRTVLVGGTSVDFYAAGAAGTSAGYPLKWRGSRDVDLVVLSVEGPGAMQKLKESLVAQLAFRPAFARTDADGNPAWSRGLDVPDFPFGLEIVNDELGGDPRGERVFVIEIEGEQLFLRGPEDTLISYAESGWHFYDGREWERALAVWRTMKGEMDLAYLERRANDRHMPGVLREIMAEHPLPGEPRPMF